MKKIVIAAGYASRLYPQTENFPNLLLQVGGRNNLQRMLDDVDALPEVDGPIIVINLAPVFEEWASRTSYSKLTPAPTAVYGFCCLSADDGLYCV